MNLALPPNSTPGLPFPDARAAETKERICRSNFERKGQTSTFVTIASQAIRLTSRRSGVGSIYIALRAWALLQAPLMA